MYVTRIFCYWVLYKGGQAWHCLQVKPIIAGLEEKIMSEKMESSQGNIAVILKFSNNVIATVSVKLIDGDGEDPADVYGTITGRFGLDTEIVLFDVKQHQHIPVRPGAFIPLNRPEVNVPSNATNFEISVYLMDYDKMSPDDEIANGKASFIVKAAGESDTRPISGRYGSVEVTVLWG